jgi:hypothetical protein
VTAMKPMNHSEFPRQSTRSASRKSAPGASLSIRARAEIECIRRKDLHLYRWLIVQNHVQQRAVHF